MEIISKMQHYVGDKAFDTIEEANSFLSYTKNPLKEIIDFFDFNGQVHEESSTYCDGDWFIYESEDYPDLGKRPRMLVSNMVVEDDLVSIDFTILKTDPNDSYDMIADKVESFGFSVDTVVKVETFIIDRYYQTLEISHDLGGEIMIQKFTYEEAGE